MKRMIEWEGCAVNFEFASQTNEKNANVCKEYM